MRLLFTFAFAVSCTAFLAQQCTAEMIHLMARKGDVAKVIAEIESGVDVDLPSTMHANLKGSSPLYVASTYGNLEVVEALLSAGADPNYRRPDYLGENTYGSPLHAAVSGGHVRVVGALLEAGADPGVSDPTIGTPLHIARLRGNSEIEMMLLESGVPTTMSSDTITHKLANADTERGQLMAGGCEQCHNMTNEEVHGDKQGPTLWNIIGREVASLEGYQYSVWLEEYGGVWTYDRLNSFLSDPYRVVPGTRMAYTGIRSDTDRADLIAYLRNLSPAPQPLP